MNEFATLLFPQTMPVPELIRFLEKNETMKQIDVQILDSSASDIILDIESRKALPGTPIPKNLDENLTRRLQDVDDAMKTIGEGFETLALKLNRFAVDYCEKYDKKADRQRLTAFWKDPDSIAYNECNVWTCVPKSVSQDSLIDVAVCHIPLDCGVSKEQLIHMVNVVKGSEILCLETDCEYGSCEGFIDFEAADTLCFDYAGLKAFLVYIMSDTSRETPDGRYVYVQKISDEWVNVRVWIGYDCN